jgi:hypothetical protein
MLVAWPDGATRGRLGRRRRPPFLAARRGAIWFAAACGRRGQGRRRGVAVFCGAEKLGRGDCSLQN